MSLSRNSKLIEISKRLCRDLRKHSSKSEKIFWESVHNRRFLNKKFYRQYPIFFDVNGKETFFIADFYCHENHLVSEIDGGYHERQEEYDLLRTHILNDWNINVVRFTNEEVENHIDSVLRRLKKYLHNGFYQFKKINSCINF